MSTTLNEVRRGFFLDSVALMRISRTVAALESVEEAALMMGTPANHEILAEAGLLAESGGTAQGGDLILAVRAQSQSAAEAALAEAGQLLSGPKGGGDSGKAWRPRTLRAAVRARPDTNLALISVPGAFAAAETRKALRCGLHVMIFSDNVSLEDEIALKQEGQRSGLLVMGPDCGTAIIGGVPLAFANAVPRGDIGVVGASGTGMQEVTSLIAQGGGGISHAIGVGGRDLKAEVGALTTLAALDALDLDQVTRQIVLVSKPPAARVAARLAERIARSDKQFIICLIGGGAVELPANARLATTLKQAAELTLGKAFSGTAPDPRAATGPRVRGLFSGGTLAAEAQVIFQAAGEPVASNAPIPGADDLTTTSACHSLIDLGDDSFTRGRPHPMIDPSVRDGPLSEALLDPETGVVLLDNVIGFGAAADPAGHLADCLERRTGNGPLIVASVTGTDGDPQDRAGQIAKLRAAGVLVAPCNADAAALAVACLRSSAPERGS